VDGDDEAAVKVVVAMAVAVTSDLLRVRSSISRKGIRRSSR
jgi:hypothetical protein